MAQRHFTLSESIGHTQEAAPAELTANTKAPASPRTDQWLHKAWRLSAAPLLLFFLLPVVMLYVRSSPVQLLESLQKEQVYLAVVTSLKTSLTSLALIILLGTPVALLMGRVQFRFKGFLDALIDLPILLPPSVAGLALLITFGRRGPIGGWLEETLGLQIAFTQIAVILAQIFIAAPIFVRSATIGFAGIDSETIQAAQIDGANRWQILWHVFFPLTRFALISGSVMCWARALGEFGATMLFAGNLMGVTQTMPTAIYLGFEMDLNTALALSVILVTICFASILIVKLLIIPHQE
jgi:molybdate transport system permease protein